MEHWNSNGEYNEDSGRLFDMVSIHLEFLYTLGRIIWMIIKKYTEIDHMFCNEH